MFDWLLLLCDRLLDFVDGGVRQTLRLSRRVERTLAKMRELESELVPLQGKKGIAQALSVLRRQMAVSEFMLDSAGRKIVLHDSSVAAYRILKIGKHTIDFAEVEERIKREYERKLAEIDAVLDQCAVCGKPTQEGAAAGCHECISRDVIES